MLDSKGNIVAELRKEADYTQKRLAEALDVAGFELAFDGCLAEKDICLYTKIQKISNFPLVFGEKAC